MLILVGVTISMAVNGGLFDYAGKAVGDTQNALDVEQKLSEGAIQVDGVWYDSIGDYLAGEPSGPVKIKLGRTGTKVTNVPLPSSDFEHVEGTIETGYVIRHKTDGNEFVWVPVEKEQKLTIEVESEKDIKKLEIYDPYGDKILEVADGDIEGTYTNTAVEPTVNGMYIAVATTENEETGEPEITQKTIIVRSLYAIDTMNDLTTSEEYAKSMVAGTEFENLSKEEIWAAMLEFESVDAMNTAIADAGCNSLNQFLTMMLGQEMKAYQDLADYTESVNNNGGFYIARYEAGIPEPKEARTSGSLDNSAEMIATIISDNGVPVSKEGMYPYNYITNAQAKGLAESMYGTNENYEVSLITGSGWDRTLGWIQETGSKTLKEIAGDSTSWGNYYNAEFQITTGNYLENYGSSYTEVSGTYTKSADRSILLTTGARNALESTPRNFANNIFDLAGNVYEWTNEADSTYYRVRRGGGHNDLGSNLPASYRSKFAPDSCISYVGFRAALYLK